MTGNVLGERFRVVSFGESHGRCVGIVIDGCPAGLPLSSEDIQPLLDLRRPGQSLVTTQRGEEDRVELLSGVFEGYTTGAPIAMLVWNRDVDSSSYVRLRNTPRPSHADYFAHIRYGGFNDWRGGGRFSGRITAGFVMAGAVALKLLKETLGIEVMAYTRQIGDLRLEHVSIESVRRYRYSNEVRCPDSEMAERMRRLILSTKEEGDSIGGVVECIATGVPPGIGDPIFGSLDADIAKAIFSIPAVRGIEFGAGFKAASMRGSEHNDPLTLREGRVAPLTNNAGGVVGGLSTGADIVFRVAFKPAASIARPQRTLNISSKREEEIVVAGRHDPSVVPRAVPVVEAITGIVLADHALTAGYIPPVLARRSG